MSSREAFHSARMPSSLYPEGGHLEYNRVRGYEVETEYHLCRCGSSTNKPFCDAMHVSVGFNDGNAAFEDQQGERDESFQDLPTM